MRKVFLLTLIILLSISSCKKKDSSYSLNISKNNKGTVNYETGKHPKGETISLEATPDEGYAFIGWHGEGLETPTDENPLTIVLDSNKSIVANFVNIENPDFSGMGLWTDEIYSSIDWDIENNVGSFIEAFVKDAERHGLDLSYVLEGDLKLEVLENNACDAAGCARQTCLDSKVHVEIKEYTYLRQPASIKSGSKCIACGPDKTDFWGRYGVGPKEFEYFYGDTPRLLLLMYHELGHDILNYSHTCVDGQLVNASSACAEGSSLEKDMKGFSWYSNDPKFSFRAAVKDLFEGVHQICIDCSNWDPPGKCYGQN